MSNLQIQFRVLEPPGGQNDPPPLTWHIPLTFSFPKFTTTATAATTTTTTTTTTATLFLFNLSIFLQIRDFYKPDALPASQTAVSNH